MRWMIVLSLSGELCGSIDLEAKKTPNENMETIPI
jgi:hypothetical protein